MRTEHIQAIQKIIGDPERVSTGKADLAAHSMDESLHAAHEPEVVVWPQSSGEISGVLKLANQHQIPVTPRGGGSSLEGNAIPVRGGIVLAMSGMDRILELRPEDFLVRVQPGLIYDRLKERLGRAGLFFPPAPGSAAVATIGGMVANNSSGVLYVKYGGTRDYVLKLEVVLPSGQIIQVGCDVPKRSTGYDLVHLFISSEGTLGVVTEITLRLRGRMEKIAALAVFETVSEVAETVREIIQAGLRPAALEIMDAQNIHYANVWKGLSLEELPTLVMEFHGNPAGVREEVELAKEICVERNCRQFQSGISAAEQERIWEGRKALREGLTYLNADCAFIFSDVVVPISRYPEAMEKAYEIGRKYDVLVAPAGQAGDGHLHTRICAKKGDAEARMQAERVNEEIVRWAIGVGGAAAGSHGIGLSKRKFMALQHGASLEIMKQIKQMLDPNGILNPGKMF